MITRVNEVLEWEEKHGGVIRVGVCSVAVRAKEPRTEERCALRNAQTFVPLAPTRIKAMLTRKMYHHNEQVFSCLPIIPLINGIITCSIKSNE